MRPNLRRRFLRIRSPHRSARPIRDRPGACQICSVVNGVRRTEWSIASGIRGLAMNVALIFVVLSLLLLQGSADAQSLCRPCRNAAQEELKKCLDAAISQEDKQWCQKKQGARV